MTGMGRAIAEAEDRRSRSDHAAWFRSDPLNVDIDIPDHIFWEAAEEHCDCGAPPDAYHDEECAVYGVWGDTVRATGIQALHIVGYPSYPRSVRDWKMPEHRRVQFFCVPCNRVVGEINGPVHMWACGNVWT